MCVLKGYTLKYNAFKNNIDRVKLTQEKLVSINPFTFIYNNTKMFE